MDCLGNDEVRSEIETSRIQLLDTSRYGLCDSVPMGCITSSDRVRVGGLERLWMWDKKMARILDEGRIARLWGGDIAQEMNSLSDRDWRG